ncbi:MAG: transcriptional regulator [archaeon]|nr:MAG: transcriptional regulator [archaeon]
MRRREPILIYMELLATLHEGERGPTRLAQACNLNYGRLATFTKPLLERGLIRSRLVEGQEVLSITEEGYKVYGAWLEVWRRLPL